MKKKSQLTQLANIGPGIARNLESVGIHTKQDIAKVGPVNIYRKLQQKYPKKNWPVCYYLYSLQGALTNTHWDDIPENKKKYFLTQIGR